MLTIAKLTEARDLLRAMNYGRENEYCVVKTRYSKKDLKRVAKARGIKLKNLVSLKD